MISKTRFKRVDKTLRREQRKRKEREQVLGTVRNKGIHKGRVDGVELAGLGRGGVTRSRRCDKVETA